MIAIDTETNGVDMFHGAKPFFVTTCNEEHVQEYWEAEVDPISRIPSWTEEDINEISESLSKSEEWIFHNTKFDIRALSCIGVKFPKSYWNRIQDTLIAAHLIASNQPHDLTSCALVHLGVNIKPLEDNLKEACREARAIAKKDYPEWRIAKIGLPEMPSAKADSEKKTSKGTQGSSPWKFDMWLPKRIAQERNYPNDHPWLRVLQEYSNADSAITLQLFKVQKMELEKRGLWEIYLERMKVLPAVADIENQGITISKKRTNELKEKYIEESKRCNRICVNLSGGNLSELSAGVTNELRNTIHNHLGLVSPKTTDKGNPSLDQYVIDEWMVTLPKNSKQLKFIQNLRFHRKRATALGYIKAYEKFWLPLNGKLDEDWHVIYSSLNPTGTDTLRFASENPNSQQISKKEIEEMDSEDSGKSARYMYGPAPGREWWSCDGQNLELRIPAYESGEKAMIELFEKPNDPPYFGSNHLLYFDILHPDKWNRNDPEGLLKAKKKYKDTWYQWTKNGDFAILYGAVAKSGTADRAYHVPGGQLKIENHLKKIKKLSQYQISHAEKYGYVETIPDKTVNPKRGYPLLCTRSIYGDIIPTVPLSYHVQGTAMWWMQKAMVRCHNYLQEVSKQRGQEYKMVLQVHDEIVFDFPKSQQDPTKPSSRKQLTNIPIIRNIQRLMEEGGNDIGIPTTVSCEYHPVTWSEGISI